MAAVRAFALPDLGEGLTSAEVVRWFVDVGDVITVDQPVAEVETAKAVVEVPCPYAGVVTSLAGPAGTGVPVGAALITVAVDEPATATSTPGSAASPGSGSGPGTGPRTGPGTGSSSGSGSVPVSGSGNILVGYGVSAEPTRPRRRRVGATIPTPRPAMPSGPTRSSGRAGSTGSAGSAGSARSAGSAGSAGLAGSSEPSGSAARTAVAVVSPLVRRLARDHGVDLQGLTGTGLGGLIMRRDVEAAVGGTPAPAPLPAESEATIVPLDAIGRRAAETFTRSRREVPDATCWVDADATGLLAARDALNAGGAEPKIGLLAILARVCVAALLRAPELNSSVVTDTDGRATGVRRHGGVHLGFAAQTPRGLAVPVVHHAEDMSTARLSAELTRLTAAARGGRLTPAELTGGTFTLNNYGVFGVDGSTPIIAHPQVAMLGVGRIVPRPWAVDGALAVRSVVQLSFTFDHRVCDGATAGAFLRFVADAVEDPTTLLRHL